MSSATISARETKISFAVLSLNRIMPFNMSFSCSCVLSSDVISSAFESLSIDISCFRCVDLLQIFGLISKWEIGRSISFTT